MGQVLVRNLEDEVIDTLKLQASASGISLEEQLRKILRAAAHPSKADLLEELKADPGHDSARASSRSRKTSFARIRDSE